MAKDNVKITKNHKIYRVKIENLVFSIISNIDGRVGESRDYESTFDIWKQISFFRRNS